MQDDPRITPRLLTIPEVAATLRTSRWSVYKRIGSGELPAIRIATGPKAPLRVDAQELEQFLYGEAL